MTTLSKMKENILKLLWQKENPVSLTEVAQETGLDIRSANMHLLGLRKAGYISATQNGYYSITESGGEALGFPRVDENMAKRVLSKTSPERAFRFYTGIDQPLDIFSDNLVDFCSEINTVDLRSVEFHAGRGDFELWIHFLGDIELAKRLRMLRESTLTGETLREKLYETIKSRCDELLRKVG